MTLLKYIDECKSWILFQEGFANNAPGSIEALNKIWHQITRYNQVGIFMDKKVEKNISWSMVYATEFIRFCKINIGFDEFGNLVLSFVARNVFQYLVSIVMNSWRVALWCCNLFNFHIPSYDLLNWSVIVDDNDDLNENCYTRIYNVGTNSSLKLKVITKMAKDSPVFGVLRQCPKDLKPSHLLLRSYIKYFDIYSIATAFEISKWRGKL